MSNQGLICSAERLTEETMVGPFAALKNKAAEKPGAFGSYDLYWAYLNAVTRLKFYEDSGLSPQQVLELAWSRRPEASGGEAALVLSRPEDGQREGTT